MPSVVTALLLGNGTGCVDVNASASTSPGMGPLHLALNKRHHRIASRFLDIDRVEETFHLTALMHAVVYDDDTLVRILLPCDPDPFILNPDSRNALFVAAERGSTAILQLLLDFYSEKGIITSSGSSSADSTAVIRSAKHSMHVHSPVCQDPHTTALHVAALFNRPTAVSYLVRRGADVNRRDGQGRTPLERAKIAGSKLAEQLDAVFFHPGALNSKAELDYVKSQVLLGTQPWFGEYNLMLGSTYASFLPHGMSTILSTNTNQANTIRDDAFSAYTQALLWYFSDNSVYAERAIAVLNSWTGLQGFISGSDQDKLLAGWTGAIFAPAAEILRLYPGWASSSIAGLQAMFRRAYYPQLKTMSTWNGNVDLTQIDAIMAVAVFNEDSDLFNQGLTRMNNRIPAYFYLSTDAKIPSIAGDGGNIPVFWSNPAKWVSGLTQETCRDYGQHVQFALGSVLHAMETAWHQGIDVYSANQDRMVAALELQALMFNTGSMQGVCKVASAPSSNRYNTWEVGYNHYHNRKGVALPNTLQLIVSQIRPNSVRDSTGWNLDYETLTHADLPSTSGPVFDTALPSARPAAPTGTGTGTGTIFRPSSRPVAAAVAPSAKPTKPVPSIVLPPPITPIASFSAAPTATEAALVDVSQSHSSDSAGSSGTTVLIIAFVAGGAGCLACVVGCLLYFFYVQGRGPTKPSSPSSSTSPSAPLPEPDQAIGVGPCKSLGSRSAEYVIV
eukprot:gene25725-34302_t